MRGTGGRRGIGIALVGVVLLCCGCCGGSAPPATRAAATATAMATATASPSETPVVPTDTVQPTAMATATPEPAPVEECTWSAAYVADVTIPDGTPTNSGLNGCCLCGPNLGYAVGDEHSAVNMILRFEPASA